MRIWSSGVSKLWLDKVLNYRGGWKTSARQLTVVDFRVLPAQQPPPSSNDGSTSTQGGSSSSNYRISVRYEPENVAVDDYEYDEGADGGGAVGFGRGRSGSCFSTSSVHSTNGDNDDDDHHPDVVGVEEEVDERQCAELRWFVKFPPARTKTNGDGESSKRTDDVVTAMFRREHAAYHYLFPAMADALDEVDAPPDCYPDVPDCIYSSCSDYDVAVVLDDLTTRGFRSPGRLDAATIEEARLALRALARFHANGAEVARQLMAAFPVGVQTGTGVDSERGGGSRRGSTASSPDEARAEALPWLDSDPYRDWDSGSWVAGALKDKGFFRRVAEALDENGSETADRAAKLKAYLDRMPCPLERMAELAEDQDFFKTYVSGECWLNNFMFRYGDEGKPLEAKMVDFHMCHYGLPQADLQFFYNFSFAGGSRKQGASFDADDKANKREEFETLLREDYYEELFRVLGVLQSPFNRNEWPFEKFLEVYRNLTESALLMAMVAVPMAFAKMEMRTNAKSTSVADGLPPVGRDRRGSFTYVAPRRGSLVNNKDNNGEDSGDRGNKEGNDKPKRGGSPKFSLFDNPEKALAATLDGVHGQVVKERLAKVLEDMVDLDVV